MWGVIFTWKVKADKIKEHAKIVDDILKLERKHAHEVLLNLTFGPGADGEMAEIQIYADEASNRKFAGRVSAEIAELSRVWGQLGDVVEGGYGAMKYDGMDFLGESFVRKAAGVGHVES